METAPHMTISFSTSAMRAVEEHSFSRVDVEVGGFLLGRISGGDVEVTDARPALAATSAQTHLTITHEAWEEILNALDSDYPGLAIVGWYHTHPGFGLFLSDYDIFIQANFFSAPGQFAMVIDPLIGEYAYFVAQGEGSTRIGGGKTNREAVAGPAENPTEARVRLLSGAAAASDRPRPPVVPVAVGVVVTAVVAGSSAWYFGMSQGQVAGSAVGPERIDQLNAELATLNGTVSDLESRLAEAQTAAEQSGPQTANAEPAPDTSGQETPVPSGPAAGGAVRVAIPHEVSPGESWWSIAERYLAGGQLYPLLKEANPDQLGLDPGDVLQIPDTGKLLEPVDDREP